MMTVDQLLTRARSAVGRSTLYWIGEGGQDPAASGPSSPLSIARTWPTLTAAQQQAFEPLAIARGIDVHDPHLVLDACDCSGFVCWALGFARKTHPAPYTSKDGWINTDSIWADAMHGGVKFQRIEQARPGALLVYPKEGSHENFGHIGIVIEANDAGHATLVAHCSADNALSPAGDAIQINAPKPFDKQDFCIKVWCRDVI